MYVGIGGDMAVRDRSIIGIFDLDNTTTSRHTRRFLSEAEQHGVVIDVSGELPKSFVLTEEFGMERVYLTQFNAAALEKLADETLADLNGDSAVTEVDAQILADILEGGTYEGKTLADLQSNDTVTVPANGSVQVSVAFSASSTVWASWRTVKI